MGRLPGDLLAYVATTLHARSRATRTQGPGQASLMDPDALESYYRGWSEYWRLSRDGFKEARRLFEATIARAPDYAPAHAALAYVTLTLAVSYKEIPTEEALPRAIEEADRALALDPDGAQSLATAGWVKFYTQWDWNGSEQMLRRAVELNPSDPQVHWMYAQLLLVRSRVDAGLEEARLALRLDPLNPTRHSNVATALYYGRRYAEAADESQILLARDPNSMIGRFGLARFMASMGRNDDAIVLIKTSLQGNEPAIRAELTRILFAAGQDKEANEHLPAIEADYRAGRLAPDYLAFVQIARHDAAGALQLLQEALVRRSSTVIWIGIDPRYDGIRSDVRFVEILRSIGLAS
jgi:tetratricopeptide (TPR) repeat protein